jgi:hypothetical protein
MKLPSHSESNGRASSSIEAPGGFALLLVVYGNAFESFALGIDPARG